MLKVAPGFSFSVILLKKNIPLLENLYHFPSVYDVRRFALNAVFYPVRKALIWNEWSNPDVIARHLGKSVLDIGCGTGHLVPFLPKNWSGRYAGVDPYPEMIERARKQHPGLKFHVGDIRTMGLRPHEYDCGIFWNVFHHIPLAERQAILGAALSACRKVIVIDMLDSDNTVISALKNAWWRATDGGYHYNTLSQWRSFFAKERAFILEEHVSAPFRHHYAAVVSGTS